MYHFFDYGMQWCAKLSKLFGRFKCILECPVAEMDLIFLVDGSTSVGRRDFETTKEWIISFVKQFEIGEYNTKIGVVK